MIDRGSRGQSDQQAATEITTHDCCLRSGCWPLDRRSVCFLDCSL